MAFLNHVIAGMDGSGAAYATKLDADVASDPAFKDKTTDLLDTRLRALVIAHDLDPKAMNSDWKALLAEMAKDYPAKGAGPTEIAVDFQKFSKDRGLSAYEERKLDQLFQYFFSDTYVQKKSTLTYMHEKKESVDGQAMKAGSFVESIISRKRNPMELKLRAFGEFVEQGFAGKDSRRHALEKFMEPYTVESPHVVGEEIRVALGRMGSVPNHVAAVSELIVPRLKTSHGFRLLRTAEQAINEVTYETHGEQKQRNKSQRDAYVQQKLNQGEFLAASDLRLHYPNLVRKMPSDGKGFFDFEIYSLDGEHTAEQQLRQLARQARKQFESGKEVYTAVVGNGVHFVALALRSDGKIQVVDSMGGASFEPGERFGKILSKALSDEKTFKGGERDFKVTHTGAQGGDSNCGIHAALNARQMALDASLESHKKVTEWIKSGPFSGNYFDFERIGSPVDKSMAPPKGGFFNAFRKETVSLIGYALDGSYLTRGGRSDFLLALEAPPAVETKPVAPVVKEAAQGGSGPKAKPLGARLDALESKVFHPSGGAHDFKAKAPVAVPAKSAAGPQKGVTGSARPIPPPVATKVGEVKPTAPLAHPSLAGGKAEVSPVTVKAAPALHPSLASKKPEAAPAAEKAGAKPALHPSLVNKTAPSLRHTLVQKAAPALHPSIAVAASSLPAKKRPALVTMPQVERIAQIVLDSGIVDRAEEVLDRRGATGNPDDRVVVDEGSVDGRASPSSLVSGSSGAKKGHTRSVSPVSSASSGQFEVSAPPDWSEDKKLNFKEWQEGILREAGTTAIPAESVDPAVNKARVALARETEKVISDGEELRAKLERARRRYLKAKDQAARGDELGAQKAVYRKARVQRRELRMAGMIEDLNEKTRLLGKMTEGSACPALEPLHGEAKEVRREWGRVLKEKVTH